MTDLRTAAQQALGALEAIREADTAGATPKMVIEARSMCEPTITALRAALAEPVLAPAPGYCKHCKQYTIEEPLPAEPVQEPVAAPPQRKPLTDEEIMDAFHAARNAKLGASQDNSKHRLSVVEIARAVERAHGIGEGA